MAYHQTTDDAGGGNIRAFGVDYSGDERESRSGGEEFFDIDFNEKPIYLLEHLATFTVNKESGIMYPADGMRRLLQLEKTTGIWSQKMQLCLDSQWLLIMDYETGNVIERFPASLIQEPTAFTSTDPLELYNNILVFIISGGSGSRSEMHIFQSQNVSAVHLVEDLKNLRNGEIITQQHEKPAINGSVMPVSSVSKSVIMPSREQQDNHHHQHLNNVDQYAISENRNFEVNMGETESEIGVANDETSSTASDKYERDVTVLNHCFDDIEKFIARLQHAAAASRELERRRRNRKTKKKDPGEGLLTLRTRPPSEKEFINIFEKFKLSFNLLAKLKAHIHDPNAPELVHFLFTPLALIVEASSDNYYESQLPSRVINPLLTCEAINLLINCVTSKETELWRSLGNAWIIPRDQWKENVGTYHPLFADGWSPDYLVTEEFGHPSPTVPTSVRKPRIDLYHSLGNFNVRGLPGISVPENIQTSDSGGIAKNNYDEYDGGTITLNEKYAMKSQQALTECTIEHDTNAMLDGNGDTGTRSEISINSTQLSGLNPISSAHTAGQKDTLLQSVTTGLHYLNARKIGRGTQPDAQRMDSNTYVTDTTANSLEINEGKNRVLEAWIDDLHAAGAKIVVVTYPRSANNDKELSVVRGEYLEILDDTRKWWKARNIRGQVAHVPHTIVTSYNYGDNKVGSCFFGQQKQVNSCEVPSSPIAPTTTALPITEKYMSN